MGYQLNELCKSSLKLGPRLDDTNDGHAKSVIDVSTTKVLGLDLFLNTLATKFETQNLAYDTASISSELTKFLKNSSPLIEWVDIRCKFCVALISVIATLATLGAVR